MANLDMILANDITAPLAIDEFEKAGFDKVFDKEKIALIMDHFVPCKDIDELAISSSSPTPQISLSSIFMLT